MTEIQLRRIKSIYGEVDGILNGIPDKTPSDVMSWSSAEQLNQAVDELSQITGINYDRFKVAHEPNMNSHYVTTASLRTKASAFAYMLQQEYDFHQSSAVTTPPLIVTIQQNQTVNLQIIPIQNLIDSTPDEGLKAILTDLKSSVEVDKDSKKTSSILAKLMEKSWEVFIKALPYILEHWGTKAS